MARAALTDFADELAAAAENARCLMPGRDDGYRARTTPKLEALIQRLEDRADEIRKGRSLAIDAGATETLRTTDFLGNLIVGTPAIGAFEFQVE